MKPAAPLTPSAGTVYFDGDCGFCRAWVDRWSPRLRARGFAFEPMQSGASRGVLGLAPGEVPGEMKLVLPDGRTLGGIHAVAALHRPFVWGWPLWLATRTPGLRQLAEAGYRFIARRRHRLAAALGLPAQCAVVGATKNPSSHENSANCRR